jgi:hypothetical protein
MKRRQNAEAAVLMRLMHVLEEGSVTHLTHEDYRFGEFIDELHEIIEHQAQQLAGS